MAVPVVQDYSVYVIETDAADLYVVVDKPTGTVEGDLLIAALANDHDRNQTSSGWTNIVSVVSPTNSASKRLRRLTAGASEPSTYTFTLDGTQATIHAAAIMRIDGHDADNPIDITGTRSATSGPLPSTVTMPSVTTTVDDCLVIRCIAQDDNDATPTTPAGTTLVDMQASGLGSGMTVGLWYESQVSAGATGTASTAGGNYEQYASITCAIAPGAAAAGGPPAGTLALMGVGI